MCECEEYNPDYDITRYSSRELTAMLSYFKGECWTIPPFSQDEIKAEIKLRISIIEAIQNSEEFKKEK